MADSNEGAISTIPKQPDAGSMCVSDWPRRIFPPVGQTRPEGFAVVFDRSILNAVHLYGQEKANVEVCGVLVGTTGIDDRGPFVHVQDSIRGEHASNQAGQVTFTAATWDHIQKEMDRRDPERRIVGWYHTHPDFGIFLSGMDLFIHKHFFDLPWQVALVYDPVRHKEGMFVWRSGEPVEEPFLVHEDVPAADFPNVILKGPPRQLGCSPPDHGVELDQRMTVLEGRVSWIRTGLVLSLALGLLGLSLLVLMIASIPGRTSNEDRPDNREVKLRSSATNDPEEDRSSRREKATPENHERQKPKIAQPEYEELPLPPEYEELPLPPEYEELPLPPEYEELPLPRPQEALEANRPTAESPKTELEPRAGTTRHPANEKQEKARKEKTGLRSDREATKRK